MSDRVSENQLAEAMGVDRAEPGKCCDACHDDDDEGYGMCEVDDPASQRWASVCCAIATHPLAHEQDTWDKIK